MNICICLKKLSENESTIPDVLNFSSQMPENQLFNIFAQVFCQVGEHRLASRCRVVFRLVKCGNKDTFPAQYQSTSPHCLTKKISETKLVCKNVKSLIKSDKEQTFLP